MITLIVCHSAEDGLLTKVINVDDDTSAGWTGIYGPLDEEDDPDGRIQKLVDYLDLKYVNMIDNLRIDEMPTEREIDTYNP